MFNTFHRFLAVRRISCGLYHFPVPRKDHVKFRFRGRLNLFRLLHPIRVLFRHQGHFTIQGFRVFRLHVKNHLSVLSFCFAIVMRGQSVVDYRICIGLKAMCFSLVHPLRQAGEILNNPFHFPVATVDSRLYLSFDQRKGHRRCARGGGGERFRIFRGREVDSVGLFSGLQRVTFHLSYDHAATAYDHGNLTVV